MHAMYYEAFEAAPEIRVLPDPTPGGVVITVEATDLGISVVTRF